MSRGFTLIEMLVVVVIIGILTTSVALTLNDHPRQNARREAQRLASLLETASSEARAGQRLLAWAAHPAGYAFLVAENTEDRSPAARWQPLMDDPLFRSRTLEDGVSFGAVSVDHQPLPPGGLLIFRRGDPPLFRIRLAANGDAGTAPIEVRGLPTGRVVVEDQRSDQPAAATVTETTTAKTSP